VQTTSNKLWAVSEAFLRELRALIEVHRTAAGIEFKAASDGAPGRKMRDRQKSVSIIPVFGVITPRDPWFGTPVSLISENLRAALADPDTGSIVLAVDSPGGETGGVTELAYEIRAARKIKPVVSFVDGFAASAAYWIASAADSIVITPSGRAGSIGVYAVHEDWSKAYDQMGVAVTLISAGEGKTDGSPYVPLSDDAKADMAEAVDEAYAQFVGDVSKGRRKPKATIHDKWQARMYGAEKSVEMGMADEVGVLGAALARATSLARDRGRVAASHAEADARMRMRARA
jgi:signal peptide peptidase SppA